MQIDRVQVGGYTYTLADGPVTVVPGDAIRVSYSFRYQMPKDSGMELWASLYSRPAGIINRVEAAQTKEMLTLKKSVDWKTCEGEIEIVVGSLPGGLYGLIVEIPEQDAGAWKDNAIKVGAGSTDLVTAIIPVMFMALMVPMMSQAFETGSEDSDGQD